MEYYRDFMLGSAGDIALLQYRWELAHAGISRVLIYGQVRFCGAYHL